MIRIVGSAAYPRFNWKNTTDIQGSAIVPTLPSTNVLFVSNHQTYFADVVMIHMACQNALGGAIDKVSSWKYLLPMKSDVCFVAAEETMRGGILPKFFTLGGAITVKRTWREAGKDIKREVDKKDTNSISLALQDGWVITFPQGTTRPYVEGRKGTAHLIKENKPLVVPIVINGFRRAFDKKGLFVKKKGVTLSCWFKAPLEIDYDAPVDQILAQVMEAIEQTEDFQ